MIPTIEILGLVPEKKEESNDYSDVISACGSEYNIGYNQAITEISRKSVGFDREKLKLTIIEKYNEAFDRGDFIVNAGELADAIIAHEKEIMVCKETERQKC